MEEKALIQRVLDGDQEAFAEIVEAYEKSVYNLCLRMCGNQEDAKDLTQEAFVKAWRGLRFYKFEAAFSTWLYRLTSNVCIDFLRQKKRRPVSSLTTEEEDGLVEQEFPDTAPIPEEAVLAQEQREAVIVAMNQLEEEFRLVLTLRVIQDLPYETIAEIMNLKIGTVKSRLARARMKLKKILLENGNNLFSVSSEEVGRRRRDDMR